MFYNVYNIYLPEEDLVFCEQNQEAYEYACYFLTNMTAEIAKFRAAQEKMLGQGYGAIYASGFSQTATLDQLNSAHSVFVHRIVSYFARKYRVAFNVKAVIKQLLPSPPVQPDWFLLTTQTAQEEYEKKLQTLRLSYTDILNCLFAQTDGQH